MRVFLDANILFSAARSDGAVRQLLRLTTDAGHERWVDGYVEAEARRNLLAKAPRAIAALDALLAECCSVAYQPISADLEKVVSPLPVDDRPVLAAAIRLGCGVLVTGDKRHFGVLYGKRVQGVVIHSPASFYLAVLRGKR